jgi:uncharacterized integral membrane protein
MCAAFVGSAIITSTAGGTADAAASGAAALLNPLCVLGALGLGVSLVQIHIYVDPLKKALQVCSCSMAQGLPWLHVGAFGIVGM